MMYFRCILVARVLLKNREITYNKVSLFLLYAKDRTQMFTLHSYLYFVETGHNVCDNRNVFVHAFKNAFAYPSISFKFTLEVPYKVRGSHRWNISALHAFVWHQEHVLISGKTSTFDFLQFDSRDNLRWEDLTGEIFSRYMGTFSI